MPTNKPPQEMSPEEYEAYLDAPLTLKDEAASDPYLGAILEGKKKRGDPMGDPEKAQPWIDRAKLIAAKLAVKSQASGASVADALAGSFQKYIQEGQPVIPPANTPEEARAKIAGMGVSQGPAGALAAKMALEAGPVFNALRASFPEKSARRVAMDAVAVLAEKAGVDDHVVLSNLGTGVVNNPTLMAHIGYRFLAGLGGMAYHIQPGAVDMGSSVPVFDEMGEVERMADAPLPTRDESIEHLRASGPEILEEILETPRAAAQLLDTAGLTTVRGAGGMSYDFGPLLEKVGADSETMKDEFRQMPALKLLEMMSIGTIPAAVSVAVKADSIPDIERGSDGQSIDPGPAAIDDTTGKPVRLAKDKGDRGAPIGETGPEAPTSVADQVGGATVKDTSQNAEGPDVSARSSTQEAASPPTPQAEARRLQRETGQLHIVDKGQVRALTARDVLAGAANKLITRETYDTAKTALKKKGSQISAGIDPTVAKELVQMGAYHAEVGVRLSQSGVVKFEWWTDQMRKEVDPNLTTKQLRKVWDTDEVRVMRETLENAGHQLAGRERGIERMFAKQFPDNPEKGKAAYREWRTGENRAQFAKKLVREENKQRFENIPKAMHDDLFLAAGSVHLDSKGNRQFGAIQRAGALQVPKKASERAAYEEIFTPGKLLEDGRVLGEIKDDFQMTYRVIWPEEAKAAWDAIRENPDAAKVVDDLNAAKEELTFYEPLQERLPAFSRHAQREQFGIEHKFTEAELENAQAFVRAAHGREAPGRWNLVPTAGALRGATLVGRARNALRPTVASTRKGQAGSIHELVYQKKLTASLEKATETTRVELVAEEIINQTVAKVLHLTHVKLKPGEAVPRGFKLLSETGDTMRKVMRSKAVQGILEASGVDPSVVSGAVIQGQGKAGQRIAVPQKILEVMRVADDRTADANPAVRAYVDASWKLANDMIGAINVWRLSRFSTTIRNALSNSIIQAARVQRDFIEGMILMARGDFDLVPDAYDRFVGDLWAIPNSMRSGVRDRVPREMMGSFVWDEITEGMWDAQPAADVFDDPHLGRVAAPLFKVLGRSAHASVRAGTWWLEKVNQFQRVDIYTKRAIIESVYEGQARVEWRRAKKEGKTDGLSAREWKERWKRSVPKAVEQIAYREMDTWGGYDYGNIPWWLRKFKGGRLGVVGRAFVPYPTYYYKLWQTHVEGFGFQNLANWRHPDRRVRARAMANTISLAAMYGWGWMLLDGFGDDTDLPEGLKDSDLPIESQRFGRIKVYGDDLGTEWWLRVYDMPFVGEAAAIRAMPVIGTGDTTVGEYIQDRISFGPAVTLGVAAATGMTNRYTRHTPRAATAGKESAPFFHFGLLTNELSLARRLTDPQKRDLGDAEREAFLRDYLTGMADYYPGASLVLEPRTIKHRREVPKYDRRAALMSYFLLNVRAQTQEQRDWAIKLAEISMLERDVELTDDDIMGALLLREQVDDLGRTEAGKIRLHGKINDKEFAKAKARLVAKHHVQSLYFEALSKGESWKNMRPVDRAFIEWQRGVRSGDIDLGRGWGLLSPSERLEALRAAQESVQNYMFKKIRMDRDTMERYEMELLSPQERRSYKRKSANP